MDVSGELMSACGFDVSVGMASMPLIKAKTFYSQRDKLSHHSKLQNGANDTVHPCSDKTLSSNSERHRVMKKRTKNQIGVKPYSRKRHKEPLRQGAQNGKTVRAVPRHEIGKLISEKFAMKPDSKKATKICKNPSLLSPELQSGRIVLHMHDGAEVNGRKSDGKVHVDTNGEANEEFSEDKIALCYKGSQNISLENSAYRTFESDSEDEGCLLRYSAIETEESTDQKKDESSECLDINKNVSPSKGMNTDKGLSDEEDNKQSVVDLDSDDDLFDSSLCSIMDKNNNILGGVECKATDEELSPMLTESIGYEGLEHETVSSDESPENLHGTAVSYETSSDNGCSESFDSLRSKECNDNDIYQDKGKPCSGNPQGLFRYFKKATRGNQTKQSIEGRNNDNLSSTVCQSENGRSSLKVKTISPKNKSFFSYNRDATIDDLASMPSILPQNELVTSLKSNVASQIKKRKKPASSPGNGRRKFEQLYIDVGQKNFGHTTCPVCGMVYTKTLPEDVMHHSKYHHDIMQKLKFKGWKSERTLMEYLDGRIIQVNPEDNSLHLKKIAELREIVDKDLGFAYTVAEYHDVEKVFLFISSKKIVGCAIAVPVKKAYPVIAAQDVPSSEKRSGPALSWCCSSTPVRALCGISRIWVLKQARRQQIASRLIDQVRRHYIYGVEVKRTELAFSDPTPDGRLFAEKYSGTPNFLVFR